MQGTKAPRHEGTKAASPPGNPLGRAGPRPSRPHAFSLTEVLIVIALIVLILALAMPAFNFISGGRSIDSAMNQVSAFLSRARTEAIGLQEIRGVMFYIDPATQREMMVLVKEVSPPTVAGVDVLLDAE